MPLNVVAPGETKAVFERVTAEWDSLDFLVHSVAFSPKDTLQGRVIGAPRDGFLTTTEVSCWSFIRMARLAEPLMTRGGTLLTMTYYGSQMVVENYNVMGVAAARERHALSRSRARSEGHPRARHLPRTTGDACPLVFRNSL